MYVEFDRNQKTGKKKRYLQLHKQGRSYTIAISLNKKPNAKHANSCTLQSRKLAPSRVGLQKNFQKSFPQTKRRADIILPSQSSQTRPKKQGDRHVVYQSKEKKPPQNTALLYQCRLFQAHRNPPAPLQTSEEKNQPLKKQKNWRKKKKNSDAPRQVLPPPIATLLRASERWKERSWKRRKREKRCTQRRAHEKDSNARIQARDMHGFWRCWENQSWAECSVLSSRDKWGGERHSGAQGAKGGGTKEGVGEGGEQFKYEEYIVPYFLKF